MKVRYTYKLRPGKQAKQALLNEWGRNRWINNQLVTDGKRPERMKYNERSYFLTQARKQIPWLREGSSAVQQQTIRKYDKAVKDAFRIKGRGLPKIKSLKHSRLSLEYPRTAFSIKYSNSKNPVLALAKGIHIPIVYSREFPSSPSSVTIYQDSCGDFFASFVVEDEYYHPLSKTGKSIGIDWGVKEVATSTIDELDFPYKHVRKDIQERKSYYQKQMSRRFKKGAKQQSNGYLRAKKRAAKIQRRARRVNTEIQRKWAQKVVKACDNLAVEDFKPKFLQKSTMARKESDIAIGQCKRILIETTKKHERKLVLIDPYNTTQTCSSCFAINKQKLTLNDRTFVCEHCGHTQQRDKNSATLILSLAGFNQTNAERVRPEWYRELESATTQAS